MRKSGVKHTTLTKIEGDFVQKPNVQVSKNCKGTRHFCRRFVKIMYMTKKSSELLGIARFKIHEGKLEDYKRLSAEAMEIARTKDTGTLQYDIYFNDDESECMVIERYRNSETLIEHAANLGDLFGAIIATVSVVHGEVLGEPSAELRANLAGGPVRLFKPFLSM